MGDRRMDGVDLQHQFIHLLLIDFKLKHVLVAMVDRGLRFKADAPHADTSLASEMKCGTRSPHKLGHMWLDA